MICAVAYKLLIMLIVSATKDFVGNILPVETNIVIATLKGRFTPATFVEAMAKHNIKLFSVSNTQIRLVLHLNVTKQMVAETISIINNL